MVSSSLQPGHDAVVETTTCHFCRRADLWLYLTCGVCQLTTHAKCYYRLGSDEAAYYETHSSETGDAKTVAALNVMQIASFQIMNR